MKTYEAMFLLDPTLASDWQAAEAEINRILERAEAKVLGIKNWGERKLAYPIGRWKRGLYALSFFEGVPENIAGVERDVQLSEKAIRVLVLRKDKMTPEAVEEALAAEPPTRVLTRGGDWGGRAATEESTSKKGSETVKEETAAKDLVDDEPVAVDAIDEEIVASDAKATDATDATDETDVTEA